MKYIVVTSLFLGALGVDAAAAPVDAVSLTTTFASVRSSSEDERRNTSSPGAPTSFDSVGFTGASTGQAAALSDLSAGQLRTSALLTNVGGTDTFADVFAFSEWIEFVTFSASAEIEFSLAIDGTLGIASSNDVAAFGSFLNIYDVTDQTSVFLSPGRVCSETQANHVIAGDAQA